MAAGAVAGASGSLIGRRVECFWEEPKEWFAGVVESFDGQSYTVRYDDGEHESGIVFDGDPTLRFVGDGAHVTKAGADAADTDDEMAVAGDSEVETSADEGAQVTAAGEDAMGKDGEATAEKVQAANTGGGDAIGRGNDADTLGASGSLVGRRVECFWEQYEEWFVGVVESFQGGSYTVRYDDGERESGIVFDGDPTLRLIDETTSPCGATVATAGGVEAADSGDEALIARHANGETDGADDHVRAPPASQPCQRQQQQQKKQQKKPLEPGEKGEEESEVIEVGDSESDDDGFCMIRSSRDPTDGPADVGDKDTPSSKRPRRTCTSPEARRAQAAAREATQARSTPSHSSKRVLEASAPTTTGGPAAKKQKKPLRSTGASSGGTKKSSTPQADESAAHAEWRKTAEPPMREFIESDLPSASDTAYINDASAFVWPPHAPRADDPPEATALRRCLTEYNRLRLQRVLSERARAEAAVGKGGKKVSQRPDTKAIEDTKRSGLCTRIKDEADALKKGWRALAYGAVVGAVHGVRVGQVFWSRAELSVTGMHFPPVAGIDCAEVCTDAGDSLKVATSIVVGGNYEDDKDDDAKAGEIVYTGAGGCDLLGNKKQVADQTLDTPVNRALANNVLAKSPVRLVRKNKLAVSYTAQRFVYDGLWDVTSQWEEKGLSGYKVLKYRLKRRDGQPAIDNVRTLAEEKKQAADKRKERARVAEVERTVKADMQQALRKERDDERKALRLEKVAAQEHAKAQRAIERAQAKEVRDAAKEAERKAREAVRAARVQMRGEKKTSAGLRKRPSPPPSPEKPQEPPLQTLIAMESQDAATSQSAATIASFCAKFGGVLGLPSRASSALVLMRVPKLRAELAHVAVAKCCPLTAWWGEVDFSENIGARWAEAADVAWPEVMRRLLLCRPLAGRQMDAASQAACGMGDTYWCARAARVSRVASHLSAQSWHELDAGDQLAAIEAIVDELVDTAEVREAIRSRAEELAEKEIAWRKAERESQRMIKEAAAAARDEMLEKLSAEADDDAEAEAAEAVAQAGAQGADAADALARQRAAKAVCAAKASKAGEIRKHVSEAIEAIKAEMADENKERRQEQVRERQRLMVRDAPIGVDREGSRYRLMAVPKLAVAMESEHGGRLSIVGSVGSDAVQARAKELGPGLEDRALFAALQVIEEDTDDDVQDEDGVASAGDAAARSAFVLRVECERAGRALRNALVVGEAAATQLPSGGEASAAKAALKKAKVALSAALRDAQLGALRAAALDVESALVATAGGQTPGAQHIDEHLARELEDREMRALPPTKSEEGAAARASGTEAETPPTSMLDSQLQDSGDQTNAEGDAHERAQAAADDAAERHHLGHADIFEMAVVEPGHLPKASTKSALPLWRVAAERAAWRYDALHATSPACVGLEAARLLGRAHAVFVDAPAVRRKRGTARG